MGYGYYSLLTLEDGTDVGGYSKSGLEEEWLLLFKPKDYYQNVKEVMQSYDKDEICILKVGYRTSLAKAQKQLAKHIKRLRVLQDEDGKQRPVTIEKKIKLLLNNAVRLNAELSKCEEKGQYIDLKMTDGFGLHFPWARENGIHKTNDWAEINPAKKLRKKMNKWENTSISLDEWILQLTEELSVVPLTNIGGLLQWYTVHMERIDGSTPVTKWIVENDFQNTYTPRQVFEKFIHEWVMDEEVISWPDYQTPKISYYEFYNLLTDMLQEYEQYCGA